MPDPLDDDSLPSRDEAASLLLEMMRIRSFEAACAELYGAGKIRGFLHLCDGQEAVAVGVIRQLLMDDAVVATYREHGHAIARGVPPASLMAEMFGRTEGTSRGRGGSMHIFDVPKRLYGGLAIVGAGLPIAVGLALADAMLARPRVTACFFGEGAVAEGSFHESLNLAALWKLPVLFICENNLYAMGTALARSQASTDLVGKARAAGVEAAVDDGMDVMAVQRVARRAVALVRGRRCPFFLELRTYRFRAHSMFDAQLYRDKGEIERWRVHDPIQVFKSRAIAAQLLTAEDVTALESRIQGEVDGAIAFAERGGLEDIASLERDVTARSPSQPASSGSRSAPWRA